MLPPDLIFQGYNGPNSISTPPKGLTAFPRPSSWILEVLLLKGRGEERREKGKGNGER